MLATLEVPAVQRASARQLASDAPPMLSPTLACTAAAKDEWFAVETENRFEKALAWKLIEAGIPYYLPLVDVVRRVAHFKRHLILPLFPNYLFVSGAELSAATLFCKTTRGVLNVLRTGNQRELRSDLSSLEIALYAKPDLEASECIRQGKRVRVLWGPFEGMMGVVEDLHESKGAVRVYVQIGIMGRAVTLDVDRSDLETIDW